MSCRSDHKFECKCLGESGFFVKLFGWSPLTHQSDLSDALLAGRTLRKCALAAADGAGDGVENAVDVDTMAFHLPDEKSAQCVTARSTAGVLLRVRESQRKAGKGKTEGKMKAASLIVPDAVGEAELVGLLLKFHCNNFGIMDELLVNVGRVL